MHARFTLSSAFLSLVPLFSTGACGSDGGDASLHASQIELDDHGMPLEDTQCEVRELDGTIRTYAYDAATRTLRSDDIRITFDAYGRYLTRGDPSGEWLHEYRYDEHGQVIKFVYSWHGGVIPSNSSDYTPKYESGVLTGLTFTTADGLRTGTTVFTYEAGRIVRKTTTRQDEGTARVDETRYRYDAEGRVHEIEQGPELVRRTYDAAGRLTSDIHDGFARDNRAPDGKPEIEQRWYYDQAGTLYRYTVDGTYSRDNPVVDGELDVDRRFSRGCSALRVLGSVEVFRLPQAPGSFDSW